MAIRRSIVVVVLALGALRCGHDEASVEGSPTKATIEDAAPPPPPPPATEDATTPADTAAPLLPAKRALFIGNSFTFSNDLPATYRALAGSAEPAREAPFIDSVLYAGYTLTAHLADARGTGSNPRLSTLLGPDAGTPEWTYVVLQEQSQIPSFPEDDPTRMQSVASAVSLSEYAAASGATSVLLMTWGYATNDYVTMQSRLETGYRDMGRAIAATGRAVKIAPVGLAFQAIYEHDILTGHDPLATASSFRQLYAGDAIHPGPAGSYLAACVVTATMHDVDPTTFTADIAGIDSTTKLVLQATARDVVATEKSRPPP
jgi:hypothetical protein